MLGVVRGLDICLGDNIMSCVICTRTLILYIHCTHINNGCETHVGWTPHPLWVCLQYVYKVHMYKYHFPNIVTSLITSYPQHVVDVTWFIAKNTGNIMAKQVFLVATSLTSGKGFWMVSILWLWLKIGVSNCIYEAISFIFIFFYFFKNDNIDIVYTVRCINIEMERCCPCSGLANHHGPLGPVVRT